MKRTQALCIALAAMLAIANCAVSEFALDSMATPSNGDPGACLLNVTYQFFPNRVLFTVDQYIPDPVNRDCNTPTITTQPLFYNQPFTPLSINLVSSGPSSTHFTGNFTRAQMLAQLGSSCYLQFDNIQYTCKFRIANINFYLDLWLATPGGTTFDTPQTRVLFPELGSAMQATIFGKAAWVPNNTWPHIIGKLEDGCGPWNWDNVINSLSTEFTITGTEYMSNVFDLHPYLANAYEFRVLVRRNGSAATSYKPVPQNGFPFANAAGPDLCTHTGVTYGSFLNNLTYCSGGCGISLGLFTSLQQYVLVTNGISTANRRLLRA